MTPTKHWYINELKNSQAPELWEVKVHYTCNGMKWIQFNTTHIVVDEDKVYDSEAKAKTEYNILLNARVQNLLKCMAEINAEIRKVSKW